MDFEITRISRFDLVLGKQWHAWKRAVIDFSTHVYQLEHRRLLIRRREPDFPEAKMVKATKMLKLDYKYIYFCYIVNISKVDPRMDSTVGGSPTTQALSLSNKIKVGVVVLSPQLYLFLIR